jgi:type IV pilus assembly protein PilE
MQEAFSSLADLRIRMEQHYQDNRSYGPTNTANCRANNSSTQDVTGARYFDYTCTTSNSGQNYTLTATGRNGSTAAGYAYTLTDSGARSTTRFGGANANTNCWAVKSASDCS